VRSFKEGSLGVAGGDKIIVVRARPNFLFGRKLNKLNFFSFLLGV
jgi:hypothetical protein